MTPCKRAALKKMREELFGLIFVKHFQFASTVRSGAAGIPVLVTRNWCHCGPGRYRSCRWAAHLHLMVFPSIKSRPERFSACSTVQESEFPGKMLANLLPQLLFYSLRLAKCELFSVTT